MLIVYHRGNACDSVRNNGAGKHKNNKQTKADVSPSQIILKDELVKIGIYKVDINFHSEVKANISIKIDKTQAK